MPMVIIMIVLPPLPYHHCCCGVLYCTFVSYLLCTVHCCAGKQETGSWFRPSQQMRTRQIRARHDLHDGIVSTLRIVQDRAIHPIPHLHPSILQAMMQPQAYPIPFSRSEHRPHVKKCRRQIRSHARVRALAREKTRKERTRWESRLRSRGMARSVGQWCSQ